MSTLYYPNSHPPRLNEDFKVAFDHIYELQRQIADLKKSQSAAPPPAPPASTGAGGPSTSMLNGLRVKAIPPTSGNAVTTLSQIPVLGYNSTSGQWETYILP